MDARRDPVNPPVDGSVTIPELLDFHWEHNAELPIYAFNRDGSDEIIEVSYLEFGRACDRVAHTLRPQRSGEDKQAVAFLALTDTIVYQAVTVGMMRAGLVPFPISPRNTTAAVVNLLQKTSCHRLITTEATLRDLIDGIRAELAANDPEFVLVIEDVPSIHELYPKLGHEKTDDPFERYPQPTTRPPIADVVVYLHSSGSTGFPKAIPQTHQSLAHWAALSSVIEFRNFRPFVRIAGMALPAFHMLGFHIQILNTLYGMNCVSVYPPTVLSKESLPIMPTPSNILQHTVKTRSNAMFIIPALLQVWAQSKEAVDVLKTLEFVAYAGGPVAPKLGDFLVESGVSLQPHYGGTEFGTPTYALTDKGDKKNWSYMAFSKRANVRWVPQGDGTFECQFLTNETHVPSIENLPDVRGYATADLWTRHPTKDYLWKIVGRIDDVIMHSSGEKTVPAPMENIILSSHLVMGAVMFGRQHDQPGVLIEPKQEYAIDVQDQEQLSELRNKLWSAPVIDEANRVAPAFSRVFKEMILITSKDKPLPRTGKGTVTRKAALETYDSEIEVLYATVESNARGEDVVPPSTWTQGDVRAWLVEQAEDINPGQVVSASVDLFEQGFDSLSTTILRRRIVGALRTSKDPATINAAEFVTQKTVYDYLTIEGLASFLVALVADPEGLTDSKSGKARIEEMVEKYSAGLDGTVPAAPSGTNPTTCVVLLTGSTGNLGAQILTSLLEDEKVELVYALNRPSTGSTTMLERHRDRFEDKALDAGMLASDKLVFVEGDAASPNLGLPEHTYEKLRVSVSLIIHNAWRLDFNQSLGSFEPNIRGTRHLIDFALSGPHPGSTRFLFTSSVSSAQSWNQENGPFPEEVMTDASVAVGGGYGEGKYVAERILARSGLQVTSFRIGQISGGLPNGAWAISDWIPIMVKSSLALGVLPSAYGTVSWVPMDAVSRTILDVAFAKERPPTALNLVHPRPVKWNDVILPVGKAVARQRMLGPEALRVVSFQKWFSLVEKRAKSASEDNLKNIPAIKLLEFFRGITEADLAIGRSHHTDAESGGLAKFATVKAQGISSTMKELAQIGTQDVELWVSYWNSVGLF
ncbi:putative aminoadipate reductase [Tricholoma matsutake]|nr:putative aminoadipate reductase [Tricholoma matsutake 945]